MIKSKTMNLFKALLLPEKNAKKIGFFRLVCASVGGLCVAYLGMSLCVALLPVKAGEAIVIALLFNTLIWAVCSVWISVAPTRLHALLRAVLPSVVFAFLLSFFFFHKGS